MTMILEQISASRRAFLGAGAAAGGGLLLSLSLPFSEGKADADSFAANACIRIGGDGQIVLTITPSRRAEWVRSGHRP